MVYLRRRRRLNKELWNDVVGTVVRGCRAEVGKKQPFSVKGQIVNILVFVDQDEKSRMFCKYAYQKREKSFHEVLLMKFKIITIEYSFL